MENRNLKLYDGDGQIINDYTGSIPSHWFPMKFYPSMQMIQLSETEYQFSDSPHSVITITVPFIVEKQDRAISIYFPISGLK